MQKVGSIREVSPLKNSIIFLTGSASLLTASNVVHVVSDQLLRMYDPQDRRTKEALPITACLSTQKARMETEGMPRSEQQGAGRPASNGAALQLDYVDIMINSQQYMCNTLTFDIRAAPTHSPSDRHQLLPHVSNPRC
ncbi:hypothetical protein PC110_g15256 [Phytophthora cactorum]|uniref:Uncharacterized protein n=1 Tax=Phytophthora cactorum TaxID=29920 RepID=A0A329RV23_9STRA|nr:hypothetical protein PC110_g15256 [Phytophthora cactorum]